MRFDVHFIGYTLVSIQKKLYLCHVIERDTPQDCTA